MGNISRYAIYLILIISPGYCVKAQNMSFTHYDSLTYANFIEEDYNAVIKEGRKALNDGSDYYYLRMRIGISYYNLKRYDASIHQFRQALKMNRNPVVVEYLYFAYLYSGRQEEARLVLSQNRNMLEHIGEDPVKPVRRIYLEAGDKFSNGGVREIGDIMFIHGGLGHDLGSRINFYQGYSHVIQKFYQFGWVPINNGNGPGGRISEDSVEVSSGYSIHQNEYYASLSINAGSGFFIIPAYHYQGVTDLPSNNAFSIQALKRMRAFAVRFSFSRSHINQFDQYQYTPGITWYPMGNANTYVAFDYTIHKQQQYNGYYYSKAGIRILPKVWIEGFYGRGEMFNFTDFNGFYIFNIPDVITSRFGGSLIFVTGSQNSLNLGYVNENKRSSFSGTSYRHSGFYMTLMMQL